MLTPEELKELRDAGLTDSQIVTSLRKHAPDIAGDIDELRKVGLGDDKILTGILKHGGSVNTKTTEERGEELDAQTSTLGKLAYAARQGLGAGVVGGLGKTIEAVGVHSDSPFTQTIGKAAQSFGRKIAPDEKDYIPATKRFSIKDWSTYDNLPAYILEGLPQIAVAGAASALATPAAGVTAWEAMNYGANAEDRMKAQGKTLKDATGKDMAISAGLTGVEGALNIAGLKGLPLPGMGVAAAGAEKLGLQNVARGMASGVAESTTKGAGLQAMTQLPGQVVGAGIREGAAAAAGNVANQTNRVYDTPQNFSIEELGNAAALGGGLGAGIRAARGVPDAIQSTRMAPLMDNADAHTRLAAKLADTGSDLTKKEGFGDAANRVHDNLKLEFEAARKPMKDFLKYEPETKMMVDQAYERLKKPSKGSPLKDGELDQIRERIKGSPEGDALVQSLENLHALHQVKALGNWTGGKNARLEGGAEDTAFVKALSPSNWKALAGSGAAATGAAIGGSYLPSALAATPLAGVLGPAAIGAVAAAPFIVKGGAKLADAASGYGNPGNQYMKRFGDMAPPPPVNASAPRGPAPQGPGPGRVSVDEFLAQQNRPATSVTEPAAPVAPAAEVTAKATAKAEKAKAKLEEANTPVREQARADVSKGWIEIEGKKWEIPSTAKDPVAWAAGLRSNQQKIIGSFKRLEKLKDISKDAKSVVADHLDDMRNARYQSDARAVKESILSKITDEADRARVDYHFAEPFFATWSKVKRD